MSITVFGNWLFFSPLSISGEKISNKRLYFYRAKLQICLEVTFIFLSACINVILVIFSKEYVIKHYPYSWIAIITMRRFGYLDNLSALYTNRQFRNKNFYFHSWNHKSIAVVQGLIQLLNTHLIGQITFTSIQQLSLESSPLLPLYSSTEK